MEVTKLLEYSKELLNYIVDDPSKREKIIHRLERTEDLEFIGLIELHRRIEDMLDGIPNIKEISLESDRNNKRYTLLDIISDNKSPIFNENDEENLFVNRDVILPQLKNKLNKEEYEFIESLSHSNLDNELRIINLNDGIDRVHSLIGDLNPLKRKIITARPIKEIKVREDKLNIRYSKRDWSVINPIEYFNKYFNGESITRTELSKLDSGLYEVLLTKGLLDNLIQSQRNDWTTLDPVEYFKKNYRGKITSRIELIKTDRPLYRGLLKKGALNDLLPLQKRDWSVLDPVKYFKDHYEGVVSSRKELSKIDISLYQTLLWKGLLDDLLPSQKRDWSVLDPVKYFKENYGDTITTRKDLQKIDPSLYNALDKRISEVLPSKKRNWAQMDLFKYFKENYGNRELTRTQLFNINRPLYRALKKQGLLDSVITQF